MSEQRHPDIEIYIKNRSLTDIETWLNQCFESLETALSQGTIHEYSAMLNGVKIPVMVHEKVVGKAWTSIWFKSDQTPWAIDLDCAIAAAKDMETQARCIASGWSDGDEPDEWWKVEKGQQETILWQTH
ncbi:MAG: hypothetical protein ACPGF7_03870 [Pontibacterium sp.]